MLNKIFFSLMFSTTFHNQIEDFLKGSESTYHHPKTTFHPSPLGGTGVFAEGEIKKGEIVMMDRLFHGRIRCPGRANVVEQLLHYLQMNRFGVVSIIEEAFGMEAPFCFMLGHKQSDLEAFLKHRNAPSFEFAWLKNHFTFGTPEVIEAVSVVYQDGSLFNHGCQPNGVYFWTPDLTLVVFASHDVKSGEEITINYFRTSCMMGCGESE